MHISVCKGHLQLDFISKLVPLIWAPYGNRIRYHGILAPHARLRGRVVPTPDEDKRQRPKQLTLRGAGRAKRNTDSARASTPGSAASPGQAPGTATSSAEPRHRYTWSELMCRSFKHQLRCPRCGRRQLRVVQTITDPVAIEALLRTAGIRCPDVPRANPARAPPPSPQLELPFPCSAAEVDGGVAA